MGASGSIMIVDDNVNLCRTMSYILQAKGYDVTVASDGSEAIERAGEKKHFDMVFMDIKMPLMDGRNNFLAGVAFIVLNENGLVGLINTKGCEILGREDYEVLGQNWFDIAVPKELRGEAMNIFNSLISGAVDEVEHYEGDIHSVSPAEESIQSAPECVPAQNQG